jgi:hypothetical protein
MKPANTPLNQQLCANDLFRILSGLRLEKNWGRGLVSLRYIKEGLALLVYH